MDYLKRSDESWKAPYILTLTMHMTTRLGTPQELLFLFEAPQSCGPVSIKAVLQHQLTQLSCRNAVCRRGGDLNLVHVALLRHSSYKANKPVW
jgi:hypothetical protein